MLGPLQCPASIDAIHTIGIGWLASVMLKLGPNGASRPTTARKAGAVNTTAISGQPPWRHAPGRARGRLAWPNRRPSAARRTKRMNCPAARF